jgi:hypothetical protein
LRAKKLQDAIQKGGGGAGQARVFEKACSGDECRSVIIHDSGMEYFVGLTGFLNYFSAARAGKQPQMSDDFQILLPNFCNKK